MAATPVLTTKLFIPRGRREWVLRPRLVARLDTVFQCKFALISAPTGFGKTTLLSEWADGCGCPTAWLSLDSGDNDPTRFWTYFITALQNVEADLGAEALLLLRSSQRPSSEALLTGLINEIAEIPSPFAFVLDDLHVITERRIHDGLTFLLDNLPRHMHLVLSSRADPPWGLARMRVRGDMVELRANDLRFTPKEVAAFLNDGVQLGLSTEQIDTLDAQTEGWIAGLQLAVISLQGRDDVSGFIKAFSGSNRFILDYLVEEVLERQPEEVRVFLLKTSLLQQMTADLCNAVTQREDSQTILAQLDQANLFLVPLDDRRRWYRYHRLFADLLNNYLKQVYAQEVPALHQRASIWYEQNGLIADAVGHALAAGEVERAANLVEDNALSAVFQGELASLLEWLQALPDALVRSRPWLSIAFAWALAFSGQRDAIGPYLRNAESALEGMDPIPCGEDAVEMRHVRGHLSAVRTYAAAINADMAAVTDLARAALADLPETDRPTRGILTMLLGSSLRWSGDFDAASEMWIRTIAAGPANSSIQDVLGALNALASVQIEQGQLKRAGATCREALDLASEHVRKEGRPMPFAGPIYARISALLRQRNDLDGALRYARECLEISKWWGHAEGLTTGYCTLADALQADGDVEGARSAMHKARRVAANLSPWYAGIIAAREARLWVVQGNLAAASRWAEESRIAADDDFEFVDHLEYLALAHVNLFRYIRQPSKERRQELPQTLKLLERLLQMVEKAGAMGSAIEILLLQALVLQAQGRNQQAVVIIERVLALAEPEGYVRIFLDAGAPMEVLLRQATASAASSSYVRTLLAAFGQKVVTGKVSGTAKEKEQVDAVVEPLSEREIDVLRLLPTQLSSTEIAEELIIAPSTVRSHIKSIYGKLDVHRRVDAVKYARELGLL